jgi:hypothetical protein
VGHTEIIIDSIAAEAQRLSLDLGAEVGGAAIGKTGIVVGTKKGLLKLTISLNAL